MVAAFIAEHKRVFGVEPICRVLCEHGVPIAPCTYYAHQSRLPSARAQRDEALGAEIDRIFDDRQLGRGLAGVRKMWRLLQRNPRITARFGPVARCTVERLMRARGLRGVRRGKPVITTRPAKATHDRAPDLAKRKATTAGTAPSLSGG